MLACMKEVDKCRLQNSRRATEGATSSWSVKCRTLAGFTVSMSQPHLASDNGNPFGFRFATTVFKPPSAETACNNSHQDNHNAEISTPCRCALLIIFFFSGYDFFYYLYPVFLGSRSVTQPSIVTRLSSQVSVHINTAEDLLLKLLTFPLLRLLQLFPLPSFEGFWLLFLWR